MTAVGNQAYIFGGHYKRNVGECYKLSLDSFELKAIKYVNYPFVGHAAIHYQNSVILYNLVLEQ